MESLVDSAARVPVAPAMAALSSAPAGAWDVLARAEAPAAAMAAGRPSDGGAAANVVNNNYSIGRMDYDDGRHRRHRRQAVPADEDEEEVVAWR